MLHIYRATSGANRLLTLGLILLLSTTIAFAYQKNILLVDAVVLGLALAVDITARKPRFLSAVLITLGQVVVMATAVLYFATQLTVLSGGSSEFLLTLLVLIYSMITLLLLGIVASIYILRGRVWFNLLAQYILLDIAYFMVFAYTQNANITVLAAFGILTLYVVVRLRFWRQKQPTITPVNLSAKTLQRLTTFLEQAHYTLQPVTGNQVLTHVALSHEGNRILALYVLPKQVSADINKKDVLVDDLPITPSLEVFMREINTWRRAHKLPHGIILPVLLHLAPGDAWAKQLDITKRVTPDRVLGRLYLVNMTGFTKLDKVVTRQRKLRQRFVRRAGFAQ